MLYPNVETFIGCDSSYRAASIVLYGAPTIPPPATARGPVRPGCHPARKLRSGDLQPYQNADLTDFDIFDSGDLELCFGSSESALADIQSRAAEILHDGKFPLLLGGEHLVTLGAVRAMVEKYPDLHIVHFDAHADLRDDYLGAKLSHACVLRRCHDLIGDGRIHQFCIRSGDRTEFEFAAAHTEMHKFDFTGLAQLTEQLCASKVPVYLTIDLDCLDPSCFPGTGTPEAGGVSFAAAGGHPHRDQGQHRGCGPQRTGPHAGHHRRFHGHSLQGPAGAADRAGQGLAGLSGIRTDRKKDNFTDKGVTDMSKVLIIGCGGVASVAIHKCCQVPEVFTEICIASRTKAKCDKLAAELAPKTTTKITTAQVDADHVDEVIALIKSYQPDLVMNIALPYQDLTIMDACLACGVNYMDTANYEPENTDDPEWRAIYEKRCKEAGFSAYFDYSWQWAYAKKFEEAGLTALLGSGFDPGVTQAYCAYAKKHEFDTIDTIDILDCNGGDHGYAFATNFNPEINLREVSAPAATGRTATGWRFRP